MAAPRAFASFAVGQRAEMTRTVTERDVADFAALSGDVNAIHLDAAFARGTRFGDRVVHGALSFGFVAAAQTRLLGDGAVWMDASIRFLAPVRIGDTVTAVAEIVEIVAEGRVLRVRTSAHTGAGTVVLDSHSTIKHPRELDAQRA